MERITISQMAVIIKDKYDNTAQITQIDVCNGQVILHTDLQHNPINKATPKETDK